jgi:hypothetical protein
MISRSNLPCTRSGRAGVLKRSGELVPGRNRGAGSTFSRGAPTCGAMDAKSGKNGFGERWYVVTSRRARRPSATVWSTPVWRSSIRPLWFSSRW